jgi:hypothetical protein
VEEGHELARVRAAALAVGVEVLVEGGDALEEWPELVEIHGGSLAGRAGAVVGRCALTLLVGLPRKTPRDVNEQERVPTSWPLKFP